MPYGIASDRIFDKHPYVYVCADVDIWSLCIAAAAAATWFEHVARSPKKENRTAREREKVERMVREKWYGCMSERVH